MAAAPSGAEYGILGAVGVLAMLASNIFFRLFRIFGSSLEKDNLRLARERDEERARREASELAHRIDLTDFDGFLRKKGINPNEFVPASVKKAQAIQNKSSDQDSSSNAE